MPSKDFSKIIDQQKFSQLFQFYYKQQEIKSAWSSLPTNEVEFTEHHTWATAERIGLASTAFEVRPLGFRASIGTATYKNKLSEIAD